tara:strand:+ start:92 stop:697 length:606 start_codon:yes stop_codon:yes gene_type:complete
MKKSVSLALMASLLLVALAACSSDPEPTATPRPTSTPAPPAGLGADPVIPDAAEVDRKTAMMLGIDLHRQLWETRPSNNYKFGFQWTVGEYAYERANVEVRVIKNEVDDVLWASNAEKTDGTEPAGFVVPDEPNDEDYYSIDGLFTVIQEAIEADPARVSLGFDSVFGFPTSAVIEFAPDSEHEDVAFFAAQLVPIPGPPE